MGEVSDATTSKGLRVSLNRIAFFTARSIFLVFIVLSSAYALLSFIPFTYFHFLKYVPWFRRFAELHPFFYWIALLIVTPTLISDVRRKATKRITVEFLAFSVLGGCGLLVYPVLARLENDALSFVWSLVFLFPLLWIALIDIVGHRKKINWAQDEQVNDRSLLLPSVQAALFLALFFAGVSIVKQTMDRASAMSVSEMTCSHTKPGRHR